MGGHLDEVIAQPKNMIRERILTGDIWKTVLWLSLPSVATMVLQTANGLIDGLFLGRLGAAALGGVGLASQINMILMSIATAVSVGSTALIARYVGADDTKNAERAVRQAIILSVIISLASGVLAYAFGPMLIRAMGGRGEGLRLGTVYLNIVLLGVTPFYLMIILTGVFRGMGDMRTPFWVMVAMTVISIIGDYVLIFGIGPFPKLGVAGAGIATVISRLVATVMYLAYLPKSHLGRSLRGSWRPSWDWSRRILSIGSPAAAQGLLRTAASMTYFAMLGATAQGIYAIAALTIGLRTEALAFMPGFAFSVAATSMVGQNLGARQPDRAEKGAWAAAWQGVAVMGTVGLLFIIFARPLASMFTTDPNVLPLAAAYLRINGISEPFLALAMVLTGALQGAGETRLPTVATVVTLWFIRLPLTYYLAITLGLQSTGAWIAMSGSAILGGLATLAVFKWSNWKDRAI